MKTTKENIWWKKAKANKTKQKQEQLYDEKKQKEKKNSFIINWVTCIDFTLNTTEKH